jgi:hypothetical protein
MLTEYNPKYWELIHKDTAKLHAELEAAAKAEHYSNTCKKYADECGADHPEGCAICDILRKLDEVKGVK